MIAGKASLIQYLRYRISHLIYSTALPPASLMAVKRVVEIINTEFREISKRMWSHADTLWDGLTRAQFILTQSETPILSIKSGNSLRTLKWAKWFYDQGILTTPFIAPSVPERGGRIRIIAGANLKEESIEAVVNAVSNCTEVFV
jgi:7-keto-8-aminopelargonate synthetase-like enzyme